MEHATNPRGRGALSNHTGRFEAATRQTIDDGWAPQEDDPPATPTNLHRDSSRSVISRNQSPDIGFDRSINPYRGCEHGCVYCFARPTHAYLGHSAGLEFETEIYHKPDAAMLLSHELAKPKYQPKPIAMGTNTDPYQPVERWLKITRSIVEVLADARHPLTITTKSAGVVRDIDLLTPMAKDNLVRVAVSVTTLDRKLARAMEPRAATPDRRIEAIRQLTDAGIPVSVMVAPVIPGLTDHELEDILARAAAAGASSAGYILLRLPLEVADLFREWLDGIRPGYAKKVLHRLADMHGGSLYRSEFGHRQVGAGPEADLLQQRFKAACRRLGFASPPPLATNLFVRPVTEGDNAGSRQSQLQLL